MFPPSLCRLACGGWAATSRTHVPRVGCSARCADLRHGPRSLCREGSLWRVSPHLARLPSPACDLHGLGWSSWFVAAIFPGGVMIAGPTAHSAEMLADVNQAHCMKAAQVAAALCALFLRREVAGLAPSGIPSPRHLARKKTQSVAKDVIGRESGCDRPLLPSPHDSLLSHTQRILSVPGECAPCSARKSKNVRRHDGKPTMHRPHNHPDHHQRMGKSRGVSLKKCAFLPCRVFVLPRQHRVGGPHVVRARLRHSSPLPTVPCVHALCVCPPRRRNKCRAKVCARWSYRRTAPR